MYDSLPISPNIEQNHPLNRAWLSVGPAHRDWITFFFSCFSRMWSAFSLSVTIRFKKVNFVTFQQRIILVASVRSKISFASIYMEPIYRISSWDQPMQMFPNGILDILVFLDNVISNTWRSYTTISMILSIFVTIGFLTVFSICS